MKTEFTSLYALFEAIPDEKAALAHFRAIHWKDGAFCPYCGGLRIYDIKGGSKGLPRHKCGDCRLSFSVKVGTIFEDTKIPMRKWLAAVWLITSHKKGIASTQLARDIGVTQKTGWFMLHRLRHAARTRSFNRQLTGTVEADETFIGGKAKNLSLAKRKAGVPQGAKGKAIVMGLLERGGELRAGTVDSTKKAELEPVISYHVAEGATVYTDEHLAYGDLHMAYDHQSVAHRREGSAGQRLGGAAGPRDSEGPHGRRAGRVPRRQDVVDLIGKA